MKHGLRNLLMLLSIGPLLACCSGSPKPRPQAEQWHPPAEMLDKYADKNGMVTRAALEAGLKADFAVADVHHTGCLDQNVVRQINEARWKLGASTSSPLIDFRHDGCIDFDEFAATPRSLFEQLDKDGNGRLTPNELHPGRKQQKPVAQ
jgi:Ca2+-binding EF-hand superfamily protein